MSRKLSEKMVREMRDRALKGESVRSFYKEYPTTYAYARKVVNGAAWSHLPGATIRTTRGKVREVRSDGERDLHGRIQRLVARGLSQEDICESLGGWSRGRLRYWLRKLRIKPCKKKILYGICDHCGREFSVKPAANAKYCSIKCFNEYKLELSIIRWLAGHTKISRGTISKRLKKKFGEFCWTCGRKSWMGKPIPLEVDHINGIPDDNRIDNVRLLCCNCHAQTPTFRNRRRVLED